MWDLIKKNGKIGNRNWKCISEYVGAMRKTTHIGMGCIKRVRCVFSENAGT